MLKGVVQGRIHAEGEEMEKRQVAGPVPSNTKQILNGLEVLLNQYKGIHNSILSQFVIVLNQLKGIPHQD